MDSPAIAGKVFGVVFVSSFELDLSGRIESAIAFRQHDSQGKRRIFDRLSVIALIANHHTSLHFSKDKSINPMMIILEGKHE
jgi:hypothetical protein